VEAIILAGGRAERLGEAAGGLPKALVEVDGRPIAAYQVEQLAAAGVERVIVSCRAGQARLFENELQGLGPEVVAVAEPEALGRGGGARFASQARQGEGPVPVVNGDELLDLDFETLVDAHDRLGGAATIVVAPLPTAFGIVDIGDADRVRGFRDSPRLPFWAHAGITVLSEEAIERLPARGDLEQTTLPELAAEGRLYAYRHEGVWLTVNTPKELRLAKEYLAAHPGWPAAAHG
jgi:NDP-sugar pyrophosphorylase family protein